MFKPNYFVSSIILNAISQISEIKAVIERSRVLPLNEAQLRRQAIMRMAHTSTSIEGNKLAQFEVDKVLSGQSVHGDARSIQEVKNYQQALLEVEKFAEIDTPITIEQVLAIHNILMTKLLEPQKAGHFRKGPIYIVDDLGNGKEVLRFQGPPPEKVAFLINELLKWLVEAKKEEIHPVLQAAIFHVQLVTIHPFSDGNGRMARLLTTLILAKSNWDFRKIIVLEDFYNHDRQLYYNALNAVQGKSYHAGEDVTSWIEYFVIGFLVEAKKAADEISSMGFGKVSEKSEQVYLDRDELKIMDFLSTNGSITSKDVEEIIGIAKRTAQLKLKKLSGKGLIKTEGSGPSTYYTLKKE